MKSQSYYKETAYEKKNDEKQKDRDISEALAEYHSNVTDIDNRRDNKKVVK